MNDDVLSLIEPSVPLRLAVTLPSAPCSHGRGVTVTVSGAAERLDTVNAPSEPGCGACVRMAGVIASPPLLCAACEVWCSAARATPPANSAAGAAATAIHRLIGTS